MAEPATNRKLRPALSRPKDLLMRFAAPAAALAAVLAMTASVGQGDDHVTDPRAAALVAQGRAAIVAGQTEKAVDAFEAAITVDPAATGIYLDLAEAAQLAAAIAKGPQQRVLTAEAVMPDAVVTQQN
jgi:hypothetical protein